MFAFSSSNLGSGISLWANYERVTCELCRGVCVCTSVCSYTFLSARRMQCKPVLHWSKAFLFFWYQYFAKFKVVCLNVFFFSLIKSKSESERVISTQYAEHGFCNKLDCSVNTSKWLISDLLNTCRENPKTYSFHLLSNMMKDESWRSQIAGDMQLLRRTAEQQMPYERWWKMK